MPTDETSGLDVLDIDPRRGGDHWFAEHKHRLLRTRVHRTRSGGLHLFYKHDPGLRRSAVKIAAGVYVRATGGYVIWRLAAGLPVICESPAGAWPGWLRERLLPPRRQQGTRIKAPDNHALAQLVRLIGVARLLAEGLRPTPGRRGRPRKQSTAEAAS